MKLEVTKRDLEAALKVASVGAAGTGSDITTHFVFRHDADTNRTEVLSNNGRLGVSVPLICQATVSSDIRAFTVEAKRMTSWISAVDGVLTLEFDESDRKVAAKSARGGIRLNSLDADLFPYWDDTYKATEVGYSVQGKTMVSALSHVRPFIYDRDTKQPRLSVLEVKTHTDDDGKDVRWVQATDRNALGMVRCDAFQENANFRIHGKDVGNVISFLGTFKDEPVECREHDTRTFFVRGDGAMMNVARPKHAFPDLSVDTENDQYSWTLKVEDLRSSLLALLAGAPGDEALTTFKRSQGQVEISMASATGSRNMYHLELLDSQSNAEEDNFPEEGFKVPHSHVLKIISAHKPETINIGLNPKTDDSGKVRGGHCRFHEQREGDDYLVILVWS